MCGLLTIDQPNRSNCTIVDNDRIDNITNSYNMVGYLSSSQEGNLSLIDWLSWELSKRLVMVTIM